MKNRRLLWLGALLTVGAFVFVGAPRSVLAEDDPAAVTQGNARIKLPTEFVIPFLDGERFEEHAFEDGGRTLVLPGLDRTVTHEFELRPSTDAFDPATITIAPKCWKLKKVKKDLRMWMCELKAKLPKAKPKPKTPEPKEPPPEEDPDIPPMPGVPPPPPEYQQ